jgi:hypothetical protein
MRPFHSAAACLTAFIVLGGIISALIGGATSASAQIRGLAPPINTCDGMVGAYVAGCHPPSNDPCDPSNSGYHVNQLMANLTEQECARQRQQQQQSQIDEQQRQAAQQQAREEAARRQSEQQKAIDKAEARGYELIRSVKDLFLDARDLASRNAKIQITGIYRKASRSECLYGNLYDAMRDNNCVPVLTDNAHRDLREYLLQPGCQAQYGAPGCQIEVGGHMTKCHLLAAEFANYPEVPCLNIEVQIIYRPGD